MENRIAIFDNVKIAQIKIEYLEDKDYEVDIMVFTGRRSSDKNLISVSDYSGKISEISERRITLQGKLKRKT